jgi:hypothetical protein
VPRTPLQYSKRPSIVGPSTLRFVLRRKSGLSTFLLSRQPNDDRRIATPNVDLIDSIFASQHAGLRYLASANVSYNWPEHWGQTTLSGAYSHSNRNDVLFLGAPAPMKEAMDTNSDVYRVARAAHVPGRGLRVG